MYIYLITMIGDKLGSMSNKFFKRNMESKEPFKGAKANQPFKGLLISFSIFIQFLFATTINIPADYSTIQGGIDASTNGDTVLAHLIVRQTSLFDETRRMY